MDLNDIVIMVNPFSGHNPVDVEEKELLYNDRCKNFWGRLLKIQIVLKYVLLVGLFNTTFLKGIQDIISTSHHFTWAL